jgi:hypothetical protein
MKTIAQIKQKKADIKHSIESGKTLTAAGEKRLRKKIPFLNTCILYLETNPQPSFIKSELEQTEAKITILMSRFVLNNVDEIPKSEVSRMRREHEKKYGIKILREQIKTLIFLLK